MIGKPRTILTTDMECDDMNSMIHLFLYLNELDLEGIVYTSSQFHFNGDGIHTLGEVTPHYCCLGQKETNGPMPDREPDPRAKDLMMFRPFEMGWIEDLIRNEYTAVYPKLSQHAEGFPSPQELLDKVFYGNYWFEGDVRFDTEGSRLIERCIMDDRKDTLYLQSWGGVNTIVRALMSIYEKYSGSYSWPAVCEKVVKKIAILGVFGGQGQDNSFLDNDIPGKFPGIRCIRGDFGYASFMTAKSCQEDVLPMMKAEWMYPHFKINHGPLMAKYGLYGDGTVFRGECDRYQYGLLPVLDWFKGQEPIHFDKYDILGEGDSGTYIPLFTNFGLRGMEDWRYGTMLGVLHVDEMKAVDMSAMLAEMRKRGPRSNPFLKAYHEDFAARADWCVKDYAEANHNPVVKLSAYDITAEAGTRICGIKGAVADVRPCQAKWWLYRDGSRYDGDFDAVCVEQSDQLELAFVVPKDAKAGDYFNLILEARNEHENPMTGYGQLIVTVG